MVAGEQPFMIYVVVFVGAVFFRLTDILPTYPDRCGFSGGEAEKFSFFELAY